MSDRDQEIISSLRRAYEAFSSADFDAAVEIAHPDVVFVPPGGQSPLRGADALRHGWSQHTWVRRGADLPPGDLHPRGNRWVLAMPRAMSHNTAACSRLAAPMASLGS